MWTEIDTKEKLQVLRETALEELRRKWTKPGPNSCEVEREPEPETKSTRRMSV